MIILGISMGILENSEIDGIEIENYLILKKNIN